MLTFRRREDIQFSSEGCKGRNREGGEERE